MSWQKRLRDEIEQVRRYARDLEKKNAHLRVEMRNISAGVYFVRDEEFSVHTRLQLRAASALETEAAMPNNKVYV